MNIHDFPEEFNENHISQLLTFVFNKQKDLALKYQEIESKNGFHYPLNLTLDLNNRFDQTLLKNMAWRVIEEIGESIEALEQNSPEQLIHAKEELADGLHFITELCILSGLSAENFNVEFILSIYNAKGEKDITIKDNLYDFVCKIGISMNCLKMKPWKNTPYLTDVPVYIGYLQEAYYSYVFLMLKIMTPLEILNYYFRKSQVNQFRQRSNY